MRKGTEIIDPCPRRMHVLHPLFQPASVAERIAHALLEHMIPIMRRLKSDRTEFRKIDLALLIQDRFIDAHIFDLADDVAVFIYLHQGAFQRDGKLFDQRRVDLIALDRMETGFFQNLPEFIPI